MRKREKRGRDRKERKSRYGEREREKRGRERKEPERWKRGRARREGEKESVTERERDER